MSVAPGRPTVEDVALLLRARTKDANGTEVGTFDDETRPTADEVEGHITAAMGLVGIRVPDVDKLTDEATVAFSALVAYRAAMRVEKSYFPEQVRSDRSAYEQLRQEYLDDLQALLDAIEDGSALDPGVPVVAAGIATIPVGSWTTIGGCIPPAAA